MDGNRNPSNFPTLIQSKKFKTTELIEIPYNREMLNLPPEIIMEILARLPVKSLLSIRDRRRPVPRCLDRWLDELFTEAAAVIIQADQTVQQPAKFRNVRTPKVVGIYMEPSVEYIVAVLSILRCGEAFMPLDPTWPKARVLSIISSSRADLVFGIESSPERNCCHMLDTLKWLIDEGSCPVLHVSMKEHIKEKSHPLLLGWPCESESERSFCYLITLQVLAESLKVYVALKLVFLVVFYGCKTCILYMKEM